MHLRILLICRGKYDGQIMPTVFTFSFVSCSGRMSAPTTLRTPTPPRLRTRHLQDRLPTAPRYDPRWLSLHSAIALRVFTPSPAAPFSPLLSAAYHYAPPFHSKIHSTPRLYPILSLGSLREATYEPPEPLPLTPRLLRPPPSPPPHSCVRAEGEQVPHRGRRRLGLG